MCSIEARNEPYYLGSTVFGIWEMKTSTDTYSINNQLDSYYGTMNNGFYDLLLKIVSKLPILQEQQFKVEKTAAASDLGSFLCTVLAATISLLLPS